MGGDDQRLLQVVPSSSATRSVDLVLRRATSLRRHLAVPHSDPVIGADVMALGSELAAMESQDDRSSPRPRDEEDRVTRRAPARSSTACRATGRRRRRRDRSATTSSTAAEEACVESPASESLRFPATIGALSSSSSPAHPAHQEGRSGDPDGEKSPRCHASTVLPPRAGAQRCQHVVALTCWHRRSAYSFQRTSLPAGPARSSWSRGANWVCRCLNPSPDSTLTVA